MWESPEPKKGYDVIIVGGGGHGLAFGFEDETREMWLTGHANGGQKRRKSFSFHGEMVS